MGARSEKGNPEERLGVKADGPASVRFSRQGKAVCWLAAPGFLIYGSVV